MSNQQKLTPSELLFSVFIIFIIFIIIIFLEAMDKLRGMKTPKLMREALAEFMGTLILCVSSYIHIFLLLETLYKNIELLRFDRNLRTLLRLRFKKMEISLLIV